MSFWETERALHHGTPAVDLAGAYTTLAPEDKVPDSWTLEDVPLMDKDGLEALLDFAVQKTDYGEALRDTFAYMLRIAAVRLVLRNDKQQIVGTAVGVPVTLRNVPQPFLLSTMLAIRQIDHKSGFVQKFLRKTFEYTASKGYVTRLFTGIKELSAATLSPQMVRRRVFRAMPQFRPDALFVSGVITPRTAPVWLAFMQAHGPRWGPELTADMLTDPVLVSCVLLNKDKTQWEHAAVFVSAGESHVHMLYYGCTTDKGLLKFLRSVSAVCGKCIVLDLFHENLALSDPLIEETIPSITLPRSSYVWYAHNLPDTLVNSVPLVGLPML